MYIPYGRQYIDDDDINAVVEVLKSDYLTTGPKVVEFENMVKEYVGAKYAVAVSNGTAALHVACLAAGIGEGDEVITTPITFVASANCILYCGATPIFADINPNTYNIDPEDVRRKITNKTKAIIAVHFTGQPCELDELRHIAKEYNLLIIEDAAHALGADYKGEMIGNISDLTTFSFHPVKHITTGEGGMITTNDKELYNRLVLYRSHGITRNQSLMSSYDGPWYYEQLELGFNYRVTDIQCALGISQMKKLEQFVARRREIANRYNDEFSNIKNIIIPKQLDGCNNSWHLYVIQIINENRREVVESLLAQNIGVNVHYIPVYKQPYYQNNGYKNTVCSNAEEVYSNFISLPIYPNLSDEEQNYVINKVKKLCM
ncbi:UDP-4-amino-4,6-dideoxy-N-acetyl-beta-L-altrosamine transaminase [Mobilisporobacter senegalensis]|uniref:UDP-4-amino-4, 6-dideoxy-N-acetyl-beta-L-altrosamine transaminase n=1 Tax=Mobilisporobacter senegalensis TaxID=1329262 RepID=A0A3N1XY57_9FIRM|nr:UDP-4-amino-4,6-dideoxy-N-acetyl-beta-L-altrosamine transaminase [Mobilisporobacter senegalensis]ROR31534.1 UDP-4-amino-4,6-dideoxy-N-acetyl-beta-L-altrosamine transaminase [Mobilisporobacter senegalensis]